MTLTLEEVRNTKFHIARRAGYEVTDVDNFVDRVEESFKQLVEENDMLRRQVESLQAAKQNADEAEDKYRPVAAPAQPQQPQQQQAQGEGAPERLVVTTAADASPAVVRLVQMATEQAERVVTEAEAEAQAKVDEANRRAHEITTDAETRASRVESEARVNAERMTTDAKNRADDLDRQVGARRRELFAELETERDQLKSQVGQLREFEGNYRKSFIDSLRDQLHRLENAHFEPGETPEILQHDDQNQGGSSTPRLDALLGDR
ncbi:DivIVA domain-containing protein [Enemella sp. A6]|uniref:DivIVA domain-containing protein n=1 Tax=Enemella sp. A6 TaxID=3440152 RepID=UPI003EC0A4C5